jgi:hypothetical protein
VVVIPAKAGIQFFIKLSFACPKESYKEKGTHRKNAYSASSQAKNLKLTAFSSSDSQIF